MNGNRFIGVILFVIGSVFAAIGFNNLKQGDDLNKIYFFAPFFVLIGLIHIIWPPGKMTIRELFTKKEFDPWPKHFQILFFVALIVGMGISFLGLFYIISNE